MATRTTMIPAVILAGGRATRMGGGDKALLPFGGGTLLAAVLGRLAGQAAPLAVNANKDAARFAGFGLPVLPDPVPDQPGPLAGVLAALLWAGSLGADRVLTVPCDTPFLPLDLVAQLAILPGLVIAAGADGQDHPTIALWPVGLAADLAAVLAQGERKVRLFTERHGAVRVVFPAASLRNLNSPQDLRLA